MDAEHKIIQEKLEGLAGFPKGYAPNLALKWELLESGLQHNARKNTMIWWPYYIAASLIIGLLLSVAYHSNTTNQKTVAVTHESTSPGIAPQPNKVKKDSLQTYNPSQIREQGENKSTFQMENLANDSSNPTRDSINPYNENLVIISSNVMDSSHKTTAPIPTKKQPFIEIDFNEKLPNGTIYAKDQTPKKSFKIVLGTQHNHITTAENNQPKRRLFRKSF